MMKKPGLLLLVLSVALAAGCRMASETNTAMNANAPPRSTPVSGNRSNTAVNTNGAVVVQTPPAEKKKDESLFSFPPPKVVDVTEIPVQNLMNPQGPTVFSDVSRKLTEALEKGGYEKGKYSYFWNNDNEFAIVTKMEVINTDGSVSSDPNERWEISSHLPTARNFGDYSSYLLKGKKAYYRVFAFIVTSKDYFFYEGDPPVFEMARKWMSTGKGRLGGAGAAAAIKEVPFDDAYRCYALLYLFVNHTSLDNPKAISDEQLADGLKAGLNKSASGNLKKANIVFGE